MTALEQCESCGKAIDGVCVDCHFATGSWVPRGKELSGLPVQADHTIKRDSNNSNVNDLPLGQGLGTRRTSTSLPYEPPCPSGNSEPSIIEIALDECRRGNLTPFEVELGDMPARAGAVMKAIADDMRLLMGLRLAMGESRPLPYSVRFAVDRGVAPDKATASKALRSLVKFGVVELAGSLPPRGFAQGTKLYAPPAASHVVDLHERREAA